jgi:hypothetical protein
MFHRRTGSQELYFRGEFSYTLLILNYLIRLTVSQREKAAAEGKSSIGSAVFTDTVCRGAGEFQYCYLLTPLCAVGRIFSANPEDVEVPRLALTSTCKRTKAAPKDGFREC